MMFKRVGYRLFIKSVPDGVSSSVENRATERAVRDSNPTTVVSFVPSSVKYIKIYTDVNKTRLTKNAE